MAIKFSQPEAYRNYRLACAEALTLVAKATKTISASSNPLDYIQFSASAYKHLDNIYSSIKRKETVTPENIAWKWLLLTITKATAQFIIEIKKKHEIDLEKEKGAISKFLEEAMRLPDSASFSIDAINNVSGNNIYDSARKNIPVLINEITRLTIYNTKDFIILFEDCIKVAGPHVFASEHSAFQGLLANISGPASEEARREAAWLQHYQWLNAKFSQEPVFSPDGTVKTALAEIYLNPRCYWHEKKLIKDSNGHLNKEEWKVFSGDLHNEVLSWLNKTDEEFVRVITGGPGSGKSSFALALAAQVAYSSKSRVIFIELQRFTFDGRLSVDVGSHLIERNGNAEIGGSAGFPEDPMSWIRKDNKPALIIFDGLDELTHNDDLAKQKSKDFILRASQFVSDARHDGANIRAIILGRSVACQDGLKAATLPQKVMLHVAPINQLKKEDLRPSYSIVDPMRETSIHYSDMDDDFARDQRPTYWQKWIHSQGRVGEPMPEAITNSLLSSLNVEPLLLHLLILSDFCGERWREAANNKNLVYEDILKKIHGRNLTKRNVNADYSLPDFMLLMECLGITAWRGNGRAGEETTFDEVRDHHARHRLGELKNVTAINMDSIILQTHARRVEGESNGFEFIHKSFGEYLAARGIISLAKMTYLRRSNPLDPASEHSVLFQWVKIIKDANITSEIIGFVNDEARLRFSHAEAISVKNELEVLLNWAQANGIPAHGNSDLTYRKIEEMQRCSEMALLAAGTATAASLDYFERKDDSSNHLRIFRGGESIEKIASRIGATTLIAPSLLLHHLDLSGRPLTFKNFISSDFTRTMLCDSHVANVDFGSSKLDEINLTKAQINQVDFSSSTSIGASFYNAVLNDCSFGTVVFFNANMKNMRGESMHAVEAHFEDCSFSGSVIHDSNLMASMFYSCDFSQTKLYFCNLSNTKFKECILRDTTMKGCNLIFADFSSARELDPLMLEMAYGVASGYGKTLLPDGFSPPKHWFTSLEPEEHEHSFPLGYRKAYAVWRTQFIDKDDVDLNFSNIEDEDLF